MREALSCETTTIVRSSAASSRSTYSASGSIINKVVAQKPAGMTLAMHLCRGNFKSTHAAAGNYEPVAEALLAEMNLDAYFMEYDDARSGDFRPLRFLPKNKIVVLGLVTTKFGAMESKDELKRRIDEAAKFAPLDQLCLSPQCGFSSTVHGARQQHRGAGAARQAQARGRGGTGGVGLTVRSLPPTRSDAAPKLRRSGVRQRLRILSLEWGAVGLPDIRSRDGGTRLPTRRLESSRGRARREKRDSRSD